MGAGERQSCFPLLLLLLCRLLVFRKGTAVLGALRGKWEFVAGSARWKCTTATHTPAPNATVIATLQRCGLHHPLLSGWPEGALLWQDHQHRPSCKAEVSAQSAPVAP